MEKTSRIWCPGRQMSKGFQEGGRDQLSNAVNGSIKKELQSVM